MKPLHLRTMDDAATHLGCVRSLNEDSLLCRTRDQVWLVADGMGGHAHGDYASAKLSELVGAAVLPQELGAACDVVADAIHAANAVIYGEARAKGEQMGSTVVSLIIRDRHFAVLWAGDSRAYLYREGVLHQLTVDHTQVQQMVEQGLLTPEQAAGHPMGHVLSRAVGVQESLQVDGVSDECQAGDIFLLCSDGLHGVVSDSEMAAILDVHGVVSAEILVTTCLERGAPDNVTVAVIAATEPTNLTFARNGEFA